MSQSKILVLVSGSIAAYKACALVSKLSQNGFEVKVAMSKSALNFVGAATFEALSSNKVSLDTFEEGHALDHIYLMRWADLIICAPATGNFINKISSGIADDLLTTLALAHDFKKPFLIAPAMNTQMFRHPATQKSLGILEAWGLEIIEPASGVLACKEEGEGKLAEPEILFEAIKASLKKEVPKLGIKVLITSGGCVEAIDDVRTITNTSTGQTGAALADYMVQNGFDVTFLTAKNGKRPNLKVDSMVYTDFRSLNEKLFEALKTGIYDAIIHSAAVSDYSVESLEAGGKTLDNKGVKVSSVHENINVHLKKNPKLLNEIKVKSNNALLIGFKLTRECNQDIVHNAVAKQIRESGADLVVHNCLDDISTNKSRHKYHLYDQSINKIASLDGVENLAKTLFDFIKNKN